MAGEAEALRGRAMTDPEGFWREAAHLIDWYEAPKTVLDTRLAPATQWFPDGVLNTCYNAVDRHFLAGRGDQRAICYDSPVSDTKRSFTYTQLRDEVARVAGALKRLGVGKGDRVLIYMPMVPEAAFAMLACARLGAVHSVVFGGFSGAELSTRIDDSGCKVILTASCGIEPTRLVEYKPMLDEGRRLAEHRVEHVVVLQRDQHLAILDNGEIDWAAFVEGAEPAACVPVASTDPLYILYTSGTTGKPKGVVRDNGGHAVIARLTMEQVYGRRPGDVWFTASDIGWVVGHSYIIYAPLLTGLTTIMYEGKPVGTPDAGAFWRIMEEYGVQGMFTAPTAMRAIRQQDPEGKLKARYDTSALEHQFLAGERSDPPTSDWTSALLGVPVIDNWWQTETGSPMCSNLMGVEALPMKAGSVTHACCGWDIRVLGDDGQPVPVGEIGNIVAKLPLPPGAFATLWNNHERYVSAYMEAFPGYYQTGDAGLIDADGYVHIMARTDDVINVAGHRLSTGQLEEILTGHQDVAECAVVGVADALKGQLPLGLVVLNAGCARAEAEVAAEVIALVREKLGPVAAFKNARVVEKLPKTRSGKILRAIIRAMADGQPYTVPGTIEDMGVLDQIKPLIEPNSL
ncbi:MAG: propionyl-CoA synthetase [Alphaproteobacteria bacterium TMED89]|nr:propionyl-CoA synthetase [Rhodospirillaceae bacterium]RPH18817.1 MAG: propionyl-CoA synthetase [Alphaproteobacteria bacterium TMED89]